MLIGSYSAPPLSTSNGNIGPSNHTTRDDNELKNETSSQILSGTHDTNGSFYTILNATTDDLTPVDGNITPTRTQPITRLTPPPTPPSRSSQVELTEVPLPMESPAMTHQPISEEVENQATEERPPPPCLPPLPTR